MFVSNYSFQNNTKEERKREEKIGNELKFE